MSMFFGKDKFTTRRQKNIFKGGGGNSNFDYGKTIYQDLAETTPVVIGGTLAVAGTATLTGNVTTSGSVTSVGIVSTGNASVAGNISLTGGITATNSFAGTYGGVITSGVETLLGSIIGANFNVTTDQGVNLQRIGSQKYLITRILVTNASISLTTAAGGFYTDTAKGGVTIVAASQAYSALTAATTVLNTTLAVNRTYTTTPVYLSLTTAQGAAATADVYIFGIILP